MQKCNTCQGILLPGAKFCHKCGSKIEEPENNAVENKPSSEGENVLKNEQVQIDFEIVNTIFSNQNNAKDTYEEMPPSASNDKNNSNQIADNIDFLDFKALFFNALHLRVEDEHDARQYSDFVEIFYRKKFQDTLSQRYELLLEEFSQIEKKMPLPEKPKANHLNQTVENMVDYFIYTYCTDLNEIYPKPLILRYTDTKPAQVRTATFIHDFLQLQEENLIVYRDFITMPQERLKNAFQSYLFTEREELVYFICDLSLTGSGKEGFAISNRRMYWRMPLGKPHSISFDNINQIKHEKEWLEINGLFFNVNKSLNMKMLRMMKKIKQVFG